MGDTLWKGNIGKMRLVRVNPGDGAESFKPAVE